MIVAILLAALVLFAGAFLFVLLRTARERGTLSIAVVSG